MKETKLDKEIVSKKDSQKKMMNIKELGKVVHAKEIKRNFK